MKMGDPQLADRFANRPMSAPVYSESGQRLYGLDAEIALKMQSKRDVNYEKKVLEWVGKMIDQPIVEETDTGDEWVARLQSGVLLIKLVNAIKPGTVEKWNTQDHPLAYLENIKLFIEAAKKIGIPSTSLFMAEDLHRGRNKSTFIDSLSAIARFCDDSETTDAPKFNEEAAAKPKRAPSKRWKPVETAPKIKHISELTGEDAPVNHMEVTRADGSVVYGMDAEVELKLQAKRDPNEEANILEWVEKVVGEPLGDDLAVTLKDGQMLCKLINKLSPGIVKKYNTADNVLAHLENIKIYLQACQKLGLSTTEVFHETDIKKGNLSAVVSHFRALARKAIELPDYDGPQLLLATSLTRVSSERGTAPTRFREKYNSMSALARQTSLDDKSLETGSSSTTTSQTSEEPYGSISSEPQHKSLAPQRSRSRLAPEDAKPQLHKQPSRLALPNTRDSESSHSAVSSSSPTNETTNVPSSLPNKETKPNVNQSDTNVSNTIREDTTTTSKPTTQAANIAPPPAEQNAQVAVPVSIPAISPSIAATALRSVGVGGQWLWSFVSFTTRVALSPITYPLSYVTSFWRKPAPKPAAEPVPAAQTNTQQPATPAPTQQPTSTTQQKTKDEQEAEKKAAEQKAAEQKAAEQKAAIEQQEKLRRKAEEHQARMRENAEKRRKEEEERQRQREEELRKSRERAEREAKAAAERAEMERLQREKVREERERVEKEESEREESERVERKIKEREEKERIERETREREVKERVEREEREREEKERIEREEREREEKERFERAEREEKERIEREEREAKEKIEREEGEEKERIEREQQREKEEKERIEREEKEKEEKERIEREEREEKERIEKEEREKEERERIEREVREKEEKERIEREEREEKEKIEREQREKEEKERIEKEVREKEEKERIEREEREENERIEREEREKEEKEGIEREEREKEEKEKIEREQREKEEKERIEREQREKEEQERIEREQREKEEQERIEREQREKEEQERIERELQAAKGLEAQILEKERRQSKQREPAEIPYAQQEQKLEDRQEQAETKSQGVCAVHQQQVALAQVLCGLEQAGAAREERLAALEKAAHIQQLEKEAAQSWLEPDTDWATSYAQMTLPPVSSEVCDTEAAAGAAMQRWQRAAEKKQRHASRRAHQAAAVCDMHDQWASMWAQAQAASAQEGAVAVQQQLVGALAGQQAAIGQQLAGLEAQSNQRWAALVRLEALANEKAQPPVSSEVCDTEAAAGAAMQRWQRAAEKEQRHAARRPHQAAAVCDMHDQWTSMWSQVQATNAQEGAVAVQQQLVGALAGQQAAIGQQLARLEAQSDQRWATLERLQALANEKAQPPAVSSEVCDTEAAAGAAMQRWQRAAEKKQRHAARRAHQAAAACDMHDQWASMWAQVQAASAQEGAVAVQQQLVGALAGQQAAIGQQLAGLEAQSDQRWAALERLEALANEKAQAASHWEEPGNEWVQPVDNSRMSLPPAIIAEEVCDTEAAAGAAMQRWQRAAEKKQRHAAHRAHQAAAVCDMHDQWASMWAQAQATSAQEGAVAVQQQLVGALGGQQAAIGQQLAGLEAQSDQRWAALERLQALANEKEQTIRQWEEPTLDWAQATASSSMILPPAITAAEVCDTEAAAGAAMQRWQRAAEKKQRHAARRAHQAAAVCDMHDQWASMWGQAQATSAQEGVVAVQQQLVGALAKRQVAIGQQLAGLEAQSDQRWAALERLQALANEKAQAPWEEPGVEWIQPTANTTMALPPAISTDEVCDTEAAAGAAMQRWQRAAEKKQRHTARRAHQAAAVCDMHDQWASMWAQAHTTSAQEGAVAVQQQLVRALAAQQAAISQQLAGLEAQSDQRWDALVRLEALANEKAQQTWVEPGSEWDQATASTTMTLPPAVSSEVCDTEAAARAAMQRWQRAAEKKQRHAARRAHQAAAVCDMHDQWASMCSQVNTVQASEHAGMIVQQHVGQQQTLGDRLAWLEGQAKANRQWLESLEGLAGVSSV